MKNMLYKSQIKRPTVKITGSLGESLYGKELTLLEVHDHCITSNRESSCIRCIDTHHFVQALAITETAHLDGNTANSLHRVFGTWEVVKLVRIEDKCIFRSHLTNDVLRRSGKNRGKLE